MSTSANQRVNWQENSNGPTGLLRLLGRPTAPMFAAKHTGPFQGDELGTFYQRVHAKSTLR